MLGKFIKNTAAHLINVSKDVVKDISGPLEKVDKLAVFLHAYGYLADGQVTIDEVIDAIKTLQSVYALPIDGRVDGKLLSAIEQPRCGCKDIQRLATDVLAAKWRKNELTYGIASYVDEFSKDQSRQLLNLSWQNWSNVANIKVTYIDDWSKADIVISTGRGPRDNFDGPSKTLAWAYLPDGRDSQLLMKFDVDETWITNPLARGILFVNVATHEFGHLLGLDHSKVSSALMAPYYSVNVSEPQKNDDIPRIQTLYGAKPNAPTEPTELDKLTISLKGKIAEIMIPGYTISKN